jgi:hypothetical protein
MNVIFLGNRYCELSLLSEMTHDTPYVSTSVKAAFDLINRCSVKKVFFNLKSNAAPSRKILLDSAIHK